MSCRSSEQLSLPMIGQNGEGGKISKDVFLAVISLKHLILSKIDQFEIWQTFSGSSLETRWLYLKGQKLSEANCLVFISSKKTNQIIFLILP